MCWGVSLPRFKTNHKQTFFPLVVHGYTTKHTHTHTHTHTKHTYTHTNTHTQSSFHSLFVLPEKVDQPTYTTGQNIGREQCGPGKIVCSVRSVNEWPENVKVDSGGTLLG